ncbi:MAG: alginate lyase family protein, partial [Armatimonadota bacterium]
GWFGVKIVDFPLGDGYSVVYRIPSDDLLTGEWATARLPLDEPVAQWGDEPVKDRQFITFRVTDISDGQPTIDIDDVAVVRSPVKAEITSTGSSEMENNRLNRSVTLSLHNRTNDDADVAISVMSDDDRVSGQFPDTTTVAAGATREVEGTVLVADVAALEPLTRFDTEIAVTLAGTAESERVEFALAVPLPDIGHPCLLVSRSELSQVLERIEKYDWAQQARDQIVRNADDWVDTEIEIPDEGGQWSHWYTCEKCGVRLQTKSPKEHVCPKCGKVYTGWPYDQVVVTRRHRALSGAVKSLGLAYLLTDEHKYADKAAEIILGYAERYLDYPLHTKHGPNPKGVHVNSGGLQESTWLIPLVQGFDCIYDTLTPQEQETIASDLLLPAAKLIRGFATHIHNIPCWENSAYGLVGLTLGEDELASGAINGDFGFRNQIVEGVTDDGQWYEGSWGYHYYTMSALEPLATAAEHFNIDLYTDRYRGMFTAPVQMMGPTGRLPAFNDSSRSSAMSSGRRYENACSHWSAPEIAMVASRGSRTSVEALLYGPDHIKAASRELSSHIFPATGQVIMRTSSGHPKQDVIARVPDNYVALDYGPHGGWHGHPDKLNFEFYARGALAGVDAGNVAYGNPAHRGWYTQTLSHNSVTVDRKSQDATTGELVTSVFGENVAVCVTTADGAYEDVALTRIMALLDDRLLDVTVAASDSEHEYDWTYHNLGELIMDMSGSTLDEPPGEGPYEWAEEWKTMGEADTWSGEWVIENGPVLRVSQVASAPAGIFTAIGRGCPSPNPAPFVMSRQNGQSAAWATAMYFGADDDSPDIRLLQPQSSDLSRGSLCVGLECKAGDAREVLLYSENGGISAGGVTLEGSLALVRWSGDYVTQVLVADGSSIHISGQ